MYFKIFLRSNKFKEIQKLLKKLYGYPRKGYIKTKNPSFFLPKSLNPDKGKFGGGPELKENPGGNRLGGNLQSAKANNFSPKLPNVAQAYRKALR